MGVSADEDYVCQSVLPGESARVRFTGPFQGRDITWEMKLQTLESWLRQHEQGEDPSSPTPNIPTRGVIEVGPEHTGKRQLVVALNVELIDRPTVRKTVMMIRNYRGLRPGRHSWGNDYRQQET